MLIDRYPAEDVSARVPRLPTPGDPALRLVDRVLADEPLSQLWCARTRCDVIPTPPTTTGTPRPRT
jgi:hypothetical protein